LGDGGRGRGAVALVAAAVDGLEAGGGTHGAGGRSSATRAGADGGAGRGGGAEDRKRAWHGGRGSATRPWADRVQESRVPRWGGIWCGKVK
jgi:hypothetical protein